MMVFVLDRRENILGKGENAGYNHFVLFPQCFRNGSSPWMLELGIVRYRVKKTPGCSLKGQVPNTHLNYNHGTRVVLQVCVIVFSTSHFRMTENQRQCSKDNLDLDN